MEICSISKTFETWTCLQNKLTQKVSQSLLKTQEQHSDYTSYILYPITPRTNNTLNLFCSLHESFSVLAIFWQELETWFCEKSQAGLKCHKMLPCITIETHGENSFPSKLNIKKFNKKCLNVKFFFSSLKREICPALHMLCVINFNREVQFNPKWIRRR